MTDSGWLILQVFRASALPPGYEPRFNVAPGQTVLAALGGPDNRRLGNLRWGLVPSWAKAPSVGYKMINARAETIAEKPSFRTALRKRRCAIVADGFFEWRKGADGKTKVPHYFRLSSGHPFAFAGLWERWTPPAAAPDRDNGSDPIELPAPLHTCTIVTTTPNAVTEPVHHRMPVILTGDAIDLWLDEDETDPFAMRSLLKPYPADEMEAYRVAPRVNSAQVDDPDCVRPEE